MPKRKCSSPAPDQSQTPDPLERQKRLCTERLAVAQKALVTALRFGAGFERQKHSRRKKTAKATKNTKDFARLESEYTVLKALDLERLADQQLRRTVAKVKSLREAQALTEYIAGLEKGSADPATLNVTARLYKVPAVKKGVDEAIEDLKGIVTNGGDEPSQTAATQYRKTDKSVDAKRKESEDMLDDSDEGDDPYSSFNARIAAPSSGEEDSGASISGDERPPSIGDSDSHREDDPDDNLEASSDKEEETSFNGFSSTGEKNVKDTISQGANGELDRRIPSPSEVSSTESEDHSDSHNDSLAAPSNSKSRSKASNHQPTTGSSLFLPALHATYISGSESEASDLDAEFAPRRNRRGQRARQKIAEAKFGAGAKHLGKVQQNQGWDPKRGAVSHDRRSARRGAPSGRGPQQSGGNAEPLGPTKDPVKKKLERDDAGDLHPSWQAAKAVKESKKLKIDVRGSMPGKKVMFD